MQFKFESINSLTGCYYKLTMSLINQIAKEDLQDVLGDEPSSFCTLFPLRNTAIAEPDENTSRLLFEALKCTLCQSLMQAPVYLKCAHRFCRSCIQRYIRSNSKKTCPNCCTPLLSKRELRPDDFVIDFIELAFGHIKISPNTDIQGESQTKREEESEIKVMTRHRKRQESFETQELASKPRKKRYKNTQQSEANNFERGSTFISNSSHEEEKSANGKNRVITNIFSENGFKVKNINELKLEQREINPLLFTQQELASFQTNPIKQTNNIIISGCGLNYFVDLRSKFKQQIFIKIKLESHPTKPFTPLLDISEIECSVFSTAESIIKLISQELNFCQKYINLYVVRQGVLKYVDSKQTLAVLNQDYWTNCGQFDPFDLSKAIRTLSQEDQKGSSLSFTHNARLIYFSVELEIENVKIQ